MPHAAPWTGTLPTPHVVRRLPEALRERQTTFARTGGVHAAGLFTAAGERLALREDVGRHNAVDKVVGARFLSGDSPLLPVSWSAAAPASSSSRRPLPWAWAPSSRSARPRACRSSSPGSPGSRCTASSAKIAASATPRPAHLTPGLPRCRGSALPDGPWDEQRPDADEQSASLAVRAAQDRRDRPGGTTGGPGDPQPTCSTPRQAPTSTRRPSPR